MECPCIKVMSFDLELLSEIDLYTSLDFRRSWQGTGDFSLTLCGFSEKLMRKNNIIMIGDDPHKAGIIRTITPVSDKHGITTTIKGQMLNGLTSQRILLPIENNGGYFSVPPITEHRSVSAEEIIKTCISSCLGADAAENRRLLSSDNVLMLTIAENRHRGYPTEWGCRYPILSDELQSICEYCDCGYEIYIDFNTNKYVAEYLPGVIRSVNNSLSNSPVILSKEFESVTEITYSEDFSGYKNIAYCGGKGDGADRAVIAVTNDSEQAAGIDRFETFIDCGELENAETDTAMSLKTAGMHKLEEYNFIRSMTASIAQSSTFRYGEQWDLGDLVTICDETLGLMQDIRISEVLESYEPQRFLVSVTLGKPPRRISRAVRSIRNEVR